MFPLFNGWFWLGLLLVLDGAVKLGARRKVYWVKLRRPLPKWYREYGPEGAYIIQGLGEIIAGVFFIIRAYQ